jgi:hypothetical protein
LVGELLEDFVFFTSLIVFSSYICNNPTHAVDIVSHHYTAKCFQED